MTHNSTLEKILKLAPNSLWAVWAAVMSRCLGGGGGIILEGAEVSCTCNVSPTSIGEVTAYVHTT